MPISTFDDRVFEPSAAGSSYSPAERCLKGGASIPVGVFVALLVSASCGFPRPADVGDDDDAPSDASISDTGGTSDARSIDDSGTPGTPTCQLITIEPAIANANDIVMLEGTFADPVTVNFPGGASVAAMVLGSHRARVTVPMSATEGDLTITSCGSTVGPLTFRRASFAVGIGPFAANFEQTDGARQPVALATPREGHSSVAIGNHLYLIGGADSNGSLIGVEQATINADGSLGSFGTVSNVNLVTARQAHTSTVIGSHLYIVGGLGNEPLNSIEHASINADGSLGQFSTVSNVTLATARFGHTSVIVGNNLYVLGGSGNTALDSVERATINPDGSLGPFAAIPAVTLTMARRAHSAVVAGNYLYVLGGTRGSSILQEVDRATINPDGSLTPFAPVASAALTTVRSGHTSAILGNYLYVIGGMGSSGILGSIERAPLSDTGSAGSFTAVSTTTLSTPRRDHTIALMGNYLYCIGGSDGRTLASLERATLNMSGSLGSFSTVSGTTLTTETSSHASVIVGNYFYILGGSTHDESSSSRVERAVIARDGSLGSFERVSELTLETGRASHTTAVLGNYIYLLGGFGLNSIERTSINSDGSLGPFVSIPSITLTASRQRFTASVIGSFLYVVGGNDVLGALSSVERAPINADQSLGPFTAVSELTIARDGHTAIRIKDFLYIIGGTASTIVNNMPPLNSIERAAINGDGSLSPFSVVSGITLMTGRSYHTSILLGSYLYVLGGMGSHGNVDSIERAFVSSDGSLGTFETVSSIALGTVRSFNTLTVVGNAVYIVGGIGSGVTLDSIEHATLESNGSPM